MNLSASRAKLAQKNRAIPQSIPAPIGGWNARDSIADMDRTDAVILTNWFPVPTFLQQRYGYTKFSIGYPGQVETVISYAGATSTKLFGIASGKIYDATSGGAVSSAVVTGLSNSRFQQTNITTSGGSYSIIVNGADAPRSFDGTNWATPSITGVTTTNLSNVNLFKNRLWFIEKNTLKAWYLPTQSIAGAANALDMSAFAPHGGFLVAMGTWTIDAGYGVDDLAVFITSQGDVLVWRGTDPASSSTWMLVGVWYLGTPVGRRGFVKYRGDLLLLTQDGLFPLSAALQSSRVNPKVALTDKIQSAITTATTNYGNNFGWDITPFYNQNMVVLNVPVNEGSNQQQYVMNTITGAWCNFTGWSANCFNVYNNGLYFGSTNYIAQAWNGFSDNGSAINTQGLQAFSYFGSPGQLKRFTLMRPTFYVSSSPTVSGQINVDFDQSPSTAALSSSSNTAATWDNANWDGSTWGQDLTLSRVWQGTTGIGYAGAPNITTSNIGINMQWVSTDVVMEAGAIL